MATPKPYSVPSKSAAHRKLDALPAETRLALLSDLFVILEYDGDDNPGSVWSSDTTQSIGERFERYGVPFTTP